MSSQLSQTNSSVRSDEPLAPLLRKLALWAAIAPADQAALLALPHTRRTVEAHHYIVRERDKVSHSCLMLSGFSYRHKIVGTGARQIVAIHMAGDMVDLQNSLLRISDHSVQALTQSDIAMIPREALLKLALSRPGIGFALWYDTLVDGSVFREWMANIGRRDARTRLAHLLCEIALRLEAAGLGGQNQYELPMTQEQLADCTGLTPVHVNRTLKGLDRDGLITRTQRSVTIADWDALAQAGDFDSTYLHLRREPEAQLQ